jgi:hypothetical protein
MRLPVITPVAVEKLASEKSARIRTRQEALQTIFCDDLDSFTRELDMLLLVSPDSLARCDLVEGKLAAACSAISL